MSNKYTLPWLSFLHDLLPSWLLNDMGKRFLYSGFIQADYFTQLMLTSRKTSLILKEECGDDALALKAEEFGFTKYKNETNASYRSRVLRLWEIKEAIGTKYGVNLLLELVFGYNTFVITENTPNASFSVRLNQPHNIELVSSPDLAKAAETVADMRDIIKKMKASGTICSSITIQRFDLVDFNYGGC